MKQKLFTLLLAVAASIGTMFASDTQVDGIWYDFNTNDQTASVTFQGSYHYSYSNEYTGAIVIPSSVTYNSITYSVTSIGENAFLGCSGLTSVTIPNSVTSIGAGAFQYCTGLTSVNITDIAAWCNITFGGYQSSNPLSYAKHLYVNNVEVTNLVIPNSVISIGDYAFCNCTALTSVEIPNSVTSIGSSAFSGCSGLTSVEAPAGFFDLQENAWPYYTRTLNHVTVNGGELTENALLFINRSYKTLQTLDVSGVTNTEFADEAFKGYYNLQQLVLPEGLQKVSYMMVAGCINLQSIDIPASVEEIDQRAFEDCRSIKTITFGENPSLIRIGNWAFYNCHDLQNLEIPEGVTEIGDGAFYGCTYLKNLNLPASVQSIGDNGFAFCSKLQKMVVHAVTPPDIDYKTFEEVSRQTPVYVPDESVDEYENHPLWKEFFIQGISNMPQSLDEISSSLQGGDRGRLILVNGQILILRGDKTYTLTGAEVK